MDPDLDLNVMRQILKSRLREHFRACTAGCPKCEGWKKQVSDMKKRKRDKREPATTHIIPGQTECCLCLEEFVEQQEITALTCGHIYHYDCIQTLAQRWQHGKSVCPQCRQEHKVRLTNTAQQHARIVLTRAMLLTPDLAAVDIQCFLRSHSARQELTARKLKNLADTAQQRGFQVQSRNGNLIRLKLKEPPFDVQAVRNLASKQEQYRVLMRHITTNVQVNEGPRYFDYPLLIDLQVKFYAYSIPNQQDRLLEEAYAYVTQMNLVA